MTYSDFLDPRSTSFWLRVGTALICGAIIGLERQFRGKPAATVTAKQFQEGCFLAISYFISAVTELSPAPTNQPRLQSKPDKDICCYEDDAVCHI